MEILKLETIWHSFSAELLDLGLRLQSVRDWALRRGAKELYEHAVVKNEDNRPWKIQEMRYLVLRNLLHSVDRALADGRISPQVRRAIIKDFIGKVIMDMSKRMQPFRERYGCNPPFFITLSPTKKCNLHCRGCYAASSAKDAETLSYGVVKRLLREKTEEWGSYLTVISGGEPLLYRSEGKDLLDVVEENGDNYFLMFTNSTLISPEVARRMAQLGNITPAISVEGWEKETDARRGKGVFATIMRAMENLRTAGVPFGISMTATRENAELILSDALIDYYFQEQGAIYGWIFQYMPIGRSYTVDLMVTPEQRLWMLQQEIKMIYQKNLFLVDFWNGGPMTVGCIAAGRPGGYFYIDWNGNIAPCVFFPYYIDNICEIYRRNQTLTAALESRFFQAIRNWQYAYAYRQSADKVQDLFTPCSIRDHYEFAYRAVQKYGARPMDEEAAKALQDTEYRRKMCDYDRRLSCLLDPLWEREVLALEVQKPRLDSRKHVA